MKTNKILASALIGSLAFSLFPTNIFANNSLTENEKKVCEKYFKSNKIISDLVFTDSGDIYFVERAGENKFYNLLKNGEIIIENKDFFNSSAVSNDYNVSSYDYIIVGLSDVFHTEYSYDPYEKNYFMNNEKVNVIEENEDGEVKITLSTLSNGDIFIGEARGGPLGLAILFTHKNNIEIPKTKTKYFDSKGHSENFEIKDGILKVFDENKKLLTEIKNFKIDENHHNENIAFIKKENGDTYVYLTGYFGPENFTLKNVYKNGKLLCENLENNSDNSGNNGNTTDVFGGVVADPKKLEVEKDSRVETQESKEIKKEEEKIQEFNKFLNSDDAYESNISMGWGYLSGIGGPYGKYNHDINHNIKAYVIDNVEKFFAENTYNSLKHIHEKLGAKRVQELASESKFISYFVEEFEKRFEEMENYIDSIAYTLPKEEVVRIKSRIRDFVNKNNIKENLERIYDVLKNDLKLKKQAETSKTIHYAIYELAIMISGEIAKYDVTWEDTLSKELSIEEVLEKRKEAFEEYKKNLKK